MRRLVKIAALLFMLSAWQPVTAAEGPWAENAFEVEAAVPLDEAARSKLRENGFVVLPQQGRTNIYACYYGLELTQLPVLVTTDAMLYVWYEVHRELLETVERDHLAPALAEFVADLARANGKLRGRADLPGPMREAARANAVWLYVAERLCDPNSQAPADVEEPAAAHLRKIAEHAAVEAWPGEDYTQYTVRGHYAGDAALERYFLCSVWLSRKVLRVRDERAPQAAEAELRQAVAMAALLRDDPALLEGWRRVSQARRHLAGAVNAMTPEHVLSAADEVWGAEWDVAKAADDEALAALRDELGGPEYPTSEILVKVVYPEQRPAPDRLVALLPQHAVPDSVLFQSTTDPTVRRRSLPTGLEVAGALGSDRALAHLRQQTGEFPQVPGIVGDWRGRLEARSEAEWQDCLYDAWLWTLQALFERDERVPAFMRSPAWHDEKMNTCLASWAQCRHSHLLYAAPSYAVLGVARGLGVVEPIPEFYRRLGRLATLTRDRLSALDMMPGESAEHLDRLAGKCEDFAAYAEMELRGERLPDDGRDVHYFGSWLAGFPRGHEVVIADVATSVAPNMVLHVGTGEFQPLIALFEDAAGAPTAAVGWVMSYYEFAQSGVWRLDDEQWKARLESDFVRPHRPPWAASFLSGGAAIPAEAQRRLSEAEELLLAGKADDGLAALRRIAGDYADSEPGTMAQFRIGRHYFDAQQYDRAVEELGECERLYGCDASDQARRLLERARWQVERAQRDSDEADRLAALLLPTEARDGLSDEEETLRQCRRAVVLWEATAGDFAPDAGVLGRIVAECPRSPLVPAAEYLLIEASAREELFGLGLPRRRLEELAQAYLHLASRYADSQLGELAAADAAEMQCSAGEPDEAYKTLRPHLERRPRGEESHPEAVAALEARGAYRSMVAGGCAFAALESIAGRLLADAWSRGDLERIREVCARFEAHGADRPGEYAALLGHFAESGGEPLRVWARATAQLKERPTLAGEELALCRELVDRFPGSRLVPWALYRLATEGPEAERGAVGERLLRDHADSAPAWALLARRALEVGDLEAARAALTRAKQQEQKALGGGEVSRAWLNLYRMERELGEVERVVGELRAARERFAPLLPPGGGIDLQRDLRSPKDIDVTAGRILAAQPAPTAGMYLKLFDLPADARRAAEFVSTFPEHASTAEFRWALAQMRGSASRAEMLGAALAAGPDDPHYGDAKVALEAFVRGEGFRGEGGLVAVSGRAEAVRGHFPNTLAADIAAVTAARSYLNAGRPEQARGQLSAAVARLVSPEHRKDAEQLLVRCEREMAGKRSDGLRVLWRLALGEGPVVRYGIGMRPLLAGTVLVCRADCRDWTGIVGVDVASRAVVWRAGVGAATALVNGPAGRVFAATGGGRVFCLRTDDGTRLWHRDLDGGGEQSLSLAFLGGDTLVAVSSTGRCWGLAAASGRTLWQLPDLPSGGEAAALGDAAVVVVGSWGDVAAVSRDGAVLWRADPFADVRDERRPPTLAGAQVLPEQQVFVALGGQGDAWAAWLDAKTGGVARGPVQLPTGRRVSRVLVHGEGMFVVAEDAGVRALDEAGSGVIWGRRHSEAEDLATRKYHVDLMGGVLYVLGKELVALDPTTGAQVAVPPPAIAVAAPPTVAGEELLCLTRDHALVALRSPTRPAGARWGADSPSE